MWRPRLGRMAARLPTPRVLAAVMPLLLIAILLLTPVSTWVLARAAERLAPRWGWSLTVEAVDGAALLRPALRRVVAVNDGARLRVEAERVRLFPWAYAAAVVSPRVEVTLGGPGRELPQGEPGPRRLPVERLPRLSLDDGHLTVVSARDSQRLTAGKVSLQYRPLAAAPAGSLAVEVGAWRLDRPGGPSTHGSLRAQALVEPGQLTVHALAAEVSGGDLAVTATVRGTVDVAHGLPVDLRGTVQGRHAEMVEGRAEVAVTGALQPLRLDAEIAAQGAFRPVGSVTVRAAARYAPEQIALGPAEVGVAGGAVEVEATFLPALDSLVARARWRGLELQRIPGSAAHGTVAGEVAVAGQTGIGRLAGHLSAAIDDLQTPDHGALAGAPLDVTLDSRLARGGHLEVVARSRAGTLKAAGRVGAERAYSLTLTGHLLPGVLLGRDLDEVTLTGHARPDTVDLRLVLSRLPGAAAGLAPGEADLRLTGRRHLEAEVRLADGAGAIEARVDLKRARLDTVAVGVRGLELARLHPALSGRAAGQFGAGGPEAAGLRASGGIHCEALSLAGWQVGPAQLELSLDRQGARGALRAEGLEVAADLDSSLALEVRANLDGARLRRPAAEPGGAATVLALTGSVGAAGSWRDLANLEVAIELPEVAVSHGRWQARAETGLSLRHRQGRGELTPARLHTSLGPAHLTGHTRGDSLWLTAQVDTLDLAAVHDDLTSPGAVTLQVAGPLGRLSAKARVQARDLRLADLQAGRLQAQMTLDSVLVIRGRLDQRQHDQTGGGGLEWGLSAATAPIDSSLTLQLAMPLRGDRTRGADRPRARLRVEARQLQLGPLLRWGLTDSVAGLLEGTCHLEVSAGETGYDWSALEGSVAIGRAVAAGNGIRLGLQHPVEARLAPGQVEISEVTVPLEIYRRDLNAYAAAGAVRASGGLGGDRRLAVRLDSADLDAVERLPGLGHRPLPNGSLWGDLEILGEVGARQYDLKARLHLDEYGEVAGRGSAAPAGASAAAVWRSLPGDSLRAYLTVRPSPDAPGLDWAAGQLRLATTQFDVAALLELMPQLESLSAKVRGEVLVDGLRAEPDMSGRLEIGMASLTVLDVRPAYVIPAGAVVFAGSRGRLEGFAGAGPKGEGRVELGGHVDFSTPQVPQYRLALQFEDLPYRYDTVFDAPDVDGSLTLSRDLEEVLLEGEVRFTGALAEAPLVDLTAPPVPPPPAVQSPYLESMRLDVFADVRDLAVRNELADLTVEGGTRVYGTFYKPRFQGEMEITEGQVIVLNRDFTFAKGSVSLDQLVPTYSVLDLVYDPLLLNPELDLEATAQVTPIDPDEDVREVVMTVQGPALHVAPRFTCDGLDDTEVISLLAFGSPEPRGMGRGEALDALYTTAGQLVLSRSATRVGLDEFQLLPRSTVLTKEEGRALRVGKHLAFPLPMWVRYEASVRNPSIGQVRLEYDVTSYAKLKATAQSKYQVYGLGIGFRRDF